MRKYIVITLIAIVAIACLQGYYSLSQYNAFVERALSEMDEIIRISLDKELYIRDNARAQYYRKHRKQMITYAIDPPMEREKTRKGKTVFRSDTVDVERLRRSGLAETLFDAMSVITMDLCEERGYPLKLSTLDSIFTKSLKEKYAHTILLLDSKRQVIDSIGGAYDGWRQTKDICVSLKNPRFVRVMVRITPSDFIVKSVWSLSLSFMFAIIIIGVVAFQLTVIRRKEELLSARELSVNSTIHDLKAPLGGVVTLMSLLRMGEKNEERLSLICRTEERTRKLIATIEMLLLTAGGTKRRIVISRKPVDMMALAAKAKADVDTLYADKTHEIVINNHMKEGFVANVDEMYMENVMRNLIENAVKYADEGVRVDVTLENNGSEITVEVSDTGWGIPKRYLRNVFKQFYRVPRACSPKGFGIGLALVKYIVEQHGGHVSVVSFRFTISNS